MGIPGLLDIINPILISTNLKNLNIQKIGIDARIWQYKGIYSAIMNLKNISFN